jgi:zinc transport system substrate-binding protein
MRHQRVFSIALAALLAAALAGCGADNAGGNPQKNGLTVVTSFFPIYVTTINIAQNVPGVEVVNMTKPQTGCLHDYQLTTDDMKTLERADVFVVNGAGMEAFLDKAVRARQGLRVVDSSAGIPLVKDLNGADNAHVWVSVANAAAQADNIAAGLCLADPANKDRYEANAAAYKQKLETLRSRMHAALDGLENRDIITMHEAFTYFASEFDLNVAAVIEREPGADPTPQELADIVGTVKRLGIRALFAEPQYSERAARTIARETGAKVWALDPCVTGEAVPENANAYIDAMENNMKTLQEALK